MRDPVASVPTQPNINMAIISAVCLPFLAEDSVAEQSEHTSAEVPLAECVIWENISMAGKA
jgi:hypothetical protein